MSKNVGRCSGKHFICGQIAVKMEHACTCIYTHIHTHIWNLPNPAGLLWERSLVGDKPQSPSTAELPPSVSSGQRCRAVGWTVTVAPWEVCPRFPITLLKDRGFQKHSWQVWSNRKSGADSVGGKRVGACCLSLFQPVIFSPPTLLHGSGP